MSKNPDLDPKKGLKYLNKQGYDLLVQIPMGKSPKIIKMMPGSALENAEKEKLSIPLTQKYAGGLELSFSKELMERLQVTHLIDLQRLIRNISILITEFSGPVENDIFKNHLAALQGKFKENKDGTVTKMLQAIITLDSQINGKKGLKMLPSKEYLDACSILGARFILWT